MRIAGLGLSVLMLAACSRGRGPEFRPQQMELWYWHHSYMNSAEQVAGSKALIDRAARAGYTGMVLWDSNLAYIMQPAWPQLNREYLAATMQYAAARGLHVMPVAAPYGASNDMLQSNPNWAEGQRVIGTRFRVTHDGRRLEQIKSVSDTLQASARPLLSLTLDVKEWRQYHVRFRCTTRGFQGLTQIEVTDSRDKKASRLDANLHAARDAEKIYDYTFNTAQSDAARITAGVFGPYSGEIAIGDFFVEETALVYALRRDGTPLRVYDPDHPSTAFREGADFDPVHDAKLQTNPRFENDNYHDPGPVTVPAGSSLKPGQEVAMDYYAITPVYDYEAGACLTEPGVERWVRDNARQVAGLAPKGSGLMLSHDEMRHMDSCASCRAKNMSPGQLLAWSFQRTFDQLRQYGPLYVWSDMFDPYHNAHDRFYFVEGSVRGSWRGLPSEVTVMNWNLERLTPSLTWFSGDDPRQPVAHRQVIAGFYDPPDHDGAGAAQREISRAIGIPGIVGMMYTTWTGDYSQLEAYAASARKGWDDYRRARP